VEVSAGIQRHHVAFFPALLGRRAVVAGAGGEQAIFEGEAALDFGHAQSIRYLTLGVTGAMGGNHLEHRFNHQL
jgi:hypothetical protein